MRAVLLSTRHAKCENQQWVSEWVSACCVWASVRRVAGEASKRNYEYSRAIAFKESEVNNFRRTHESRVCAPKRVSAMWNSRITTASLGLFALQVRIEFAFAPKSGSNTWELRVDVSVSALWVRRTWMERGITFYVARITWSPHRASSTYFAQQLVDQFTRVQCRTVRETERLQCVRVVLR